MDRRKSRNHILAARRPAGLTAIEVIIATAIIGVVMAGFFSMIASQNKALSETVVETRVQSELRTTMDALIEIVSQSRYLSISRITGPINAPPANWATIQPWVAPYTTPPDSGTYPTLLDLGPPGTGCLDATVTPNTISGDCYTFQLPCISRVQREYNVYKAGTGRVVLTANGQPRWGYHRDMADANPLAPADAPAGSWVQNGRLSIFWIPSNEPEDTISEAVLGFDLDGDVDGDGLPGAVVLDDVYRTGTIVLVRTGPAAATDPEDSTPTGTNPAYRLDIGRATFKIAGTPAPVGPRRLFTILGPPVGDFFAWVGGKTSAVYQAPDMDGYVMATLGNDANENGRLDMVMEIRLMLLDATRATRTVRVDRGDVLLRQLTTRVRLPNTY